ncbi:pre-rRNA-processing protein PNO1, putative [Cryptosporidium muris RN66]|uniref:Pre-rRNA-processing protein PNO1, putative n=2 Tax=Cryptosporidium TaxID=5806 RepID=B6AB01_CRYMR|nr:pre-rRNA-processing protein PNO1, putative [Cryptosporidium muris RN66]EEA05553.1 pre-rRNA-processing protein PNO1, putative [Cryptosporidium muris RN66]OII76894.1 pre-rRNA-processing protein PNO1 [Cryptosporidium andersoni]|eukprot:XP_002139902.1 pre-rRNA-processing protein PNO1 [Cryptosporidium muris RN66]
MDGESVKLNVMTDSKQDSKMAFFSPLNTENIDRSNEIRRILVPANRMTPLKNKWIDIIRPLVEYMGLHVRMNIKRQCVELKYGPDCTDIGALQKGADFIKAFLLGFDLQDAIALLRIDDLYVESFDIKDVKRLNGAHLSRCIGRISGKDGKTKYAIENSTRTRIVLADQKLHIMGAYQNIKLARDALCSLILGTPPGKVYNHLKIVAKRVRERL